MEWKLAEAKNKLSEVVNRAISEGPQKITRRDDCVIVLAESEFHRLAGQKKTIVDHLMNSPSF